MVQELSKNSRDLQRDQQILNILKENGHTSVHQLCEKLYLSEATVRRSLATLAQKGLIHRTHGGAELLINFTQVGSFSSRMILNASAKHRIAQKAAQLVPDGSIVFLDQSSTCYHLAQALTKKKALTIVTNNLEIVNVLSQTPFDVIVSGGQLSHDDRSYLVGEDSQKIFLSINADFAFFSTRSLSSDGIISDCSRDEINIRNAILKNARCKVFLCDSSKFHSSSGYILCKLQDVDILISEEDASPVYASACPNLKIL